MAYNGVLYWSDWQDEESWWLGLCCLVCLHAMRHPIHGSCHQYLKHLLPFYLALPWCNSIHLRERWESRNEWEGEVGLITWRSEAVCPVYSPSSSLILTPCIMWCPRIRKVEIKNYDQERESSEGKREERRKKEEGRREGGDISNPLHTDFYSSPLVLTEGPRTSQPCLILHFVLGSVLALALM